MDRQLLSQLLEDAYKMVSNSKELETISNSLYLEAESTNRQLESMKQFQEDLDELNKLARNSTNAEMIARLNLQNSNIREIRQENRELKACLEDHQHALEAIMHKYREHIQHKVLNSQINFKEQYNEHLLNIIRDQKEKINEMAGVMQRAAQLDEQPYYKELEVLTQLKLENKGLREMLYISKEFGSTGTAVATDPSLEESISSSKEVPKLNLSNGSTSSTASTSCSSVCDQNSVIVKLPPPTLSLPSSVNFSSPSPVPLLENQNNFADDSSESESVTSEESSCTLVDENNLSDIDDIINTLSAIDEHLSEFTSTIETVNNVDCSDLKPTTVPPQQLSTTNHFPTEDT
ncbi:FGFR1OP2 family protein [Megaselia abdita]